MSLVDKEDHSACIKRIAILGSTGSIGTQALEIVRMHPERLRIELLSAGQNADLLIRQAQEFRPSHVYLKDARFQQAVRDALEDLGIRLVVEEIELLDILGGSEIDVVLTAVVGAVGLKPTVAAIRSGKRIALANKETLVVAGELIHTLAARSGSEIIPVDSEHSAIFQCLQGENIETVETLHLTASGGPFRGRAMNTFDAITREEALAHPNWSMGEKITIDSATMMNKGLEVIEAHWLFGLQPEHIEVVVHPQSIVHSMVTFRDGSVKAQLGVPDMKVPIQYAFSHPDRWEAVHERLDWHRIGILEFEAPDLEKFPCLRLAYEAIKMGGIAPAILNAANEEAVRMFLMDKIGFSEIPRVLEHILVESEPGEVSLEGLLEADNWARCRVEELCPV